MNLFTIKNVNAIFDDLKDKEVNFVMYNRLLNEGILTIDEGEERKIINITDRHGVVGKFIELETFNFKTKRTIKVEKYYLNFIQTKQLSKRVDEIWVKNLG